MNFTAFVSLASSVTSFESTIKSFTLRFTIVLPSALPTFVMSAFIVTAFPFSTLVGLIEIPPCSNSGSGTGVGVGAT